MTSYHVRRSHPIFQSWSAREPARAIEKQGPGYSVGSVMGGCASQTTPLSIWVTLSAVGLCVSVLYWANVVANLHTRHPQGDCRVNAAVWVERLGARSLWGCVCICERLGIETNKHIVCEDVAH